MRPREYFAAIAEMIVERKAQQAYDEVKHKDWYQGV